MRPYQEEVANGIVLLNEKVPNWRSKIDVRSLSMSNCLHCILGQIFGGYYGGLSKIGLNIIESSSAHGFTITRWGNDTFSNFRLLQEEWLLQLNENCHPDIVVEGE